MIYGKQSLVTIYSESSENYRFYPDEYINGVTLNVLFNNLSEFERTITKLTVYAEDIAEDYTPVLHYIEDHNDTHPLPIKSDSPFSLEITNEGWGETGDLKISVLSIEPHEREKNPTPTLLSLREGAQTEWMFPSVHPGETRTVDLLPRNDIVVEFTGSSPNGRYQINLAIQSEFGVDDTFSMTLYLSTDSNSNSYFYLNGYGKGNYNPIYYVIEVDTKKRYWTKTYKVQQTLPAKQTTYLPIHIIPTMSCDMSLQIELELENGDTIRSEPLPYSRFTVPAYKDSEKFVNGERLDSIMDWFEPDEIRIVYFPFTSY